MRLKLLEWWVLVFSLPRKRRILGRIRAREGSLKCFVGGKIYMYANLGMDKLPDEVKQNIEEAGGRYIP